MDMNSIIIVSLIVSAFILFAGVLMYGDIATRQARRAREINAAQPESRPESPAERHRDAA